MRTAVDLDRDERDPQVGRGPAAARRRAWACAGCVAIGALAACAASPIWDQTDLAVAAGGGFAAAIVLAAAGLALGRVNAADMPRRTAWALLALGVMAGAFGASLLRLNHAPPDRLDRLLEPELRSAGEWPVPLRPPLLRVRGVVASGLEPLPPAGPLRPTFGGGPTASFDLRVTEIVRDSDAGPSVVRASGVLRVTARGLDPGGRGHKPGDRIEVLGVYRPVPPPMNPGETDRRLWAGMDGGVGTLSVSSPDVITELEPGRGLVSVIGRAWLRTRGAVRERLTRLFDDEPGSQQSDRSAGAAVAIAMVLGVREGGFDETRDAFARVGIAHLLAVSGFHLSLLVVLVVGVARLWHAPPRASAVVTATVVIGYAIIVPASAPIVRAAALALALIAADAFGRRWDALTVLAWVAAGLVLWRPVDVTGLGLPLSVGVTAMLIWLAGVRHPWVFGSPKPLGTIEGRVGIGTAARIVLVRGVRSYAVIAVLAWLASVPLVAHKTGTLSLVGPLTAMLGTPVAVATLAAGFAACLLDLAGLTVIAEPIAGLAVRAGGLVAWLAGSLDAGPTSLRLPPLGSIVGVLWMISTSGVFWWLLAGTPAWSSGRSRGPVPWAAAGLCAVWLGALVAGAGRLPGEVALRIDALRVGNGTCLIVRSGGDAMLWDCGSIERDIGDRLVPRAVRALGFASIETAVVTHANTDHYNGLPDAADRIVIERLLICEPALRAAETDASFGAFMGFMTDAGVEPEPIAVGDSFTLGDATVRMLWPERTRANEPRRGLAMNDLSAVAMVEVNTHEGVRRVLLTGDVQQAGIAGLLEACADDLAAAAPIAAMELPHHGSFNEPAADLLRLVRPSVVLQSTGPRRATRREWEDAGVKRAESAWFVTAVDGASWVEIMRDGSVRSGSAIGSGSGR